MADPVAKERSPIEGRTRFEDDYYGWLQEQIALLRAGRFGEIDAENIAEELSDMGKSEYQRLQSALKVLVMHMLKWDQQPEHRSPSWHATIREQRRRISRILKNNPSLKPLRDEALLEGYEDARGWASLETHIPEDEFPKECPYDWSDVLDRPFELDRK